MLRRLPGKGRKIITPRDDVNKIQGKRFGTRANDEALDLRVVFVKGCESGEVAAP